MSSRPGARDGDQAPPAPGASQPFIAAPLAAPLATQRSTLLAALLATALLVCTLLALRGAAPHFRFTYDEADYVYAAERGWAENWLDASVIPVSDFMARGRAALGGGSSKTDLSQYIRQAGDVSFYRHFHGPLYFYWLEAGQALWGGGEAATRLGSAVLLLLTMAVALAGCLALWGRRGWWPGLMAMGLLAGSALCWPTWTQITPHALFAPLALAHLLCLAVSLKRGDRRPLYGAAAALGLCLLTIEYVPLLVLTMAACLWAWRGTLFAGLSGRQTWAFLGRLALLAVGVAAALWPGGFLKLTLARDYVFFVYLMLFRADAYGEGQGFWQTWAERLGQAPLEFAWLAAGAGLFLWAARRRGAGWGAPFLIFAGLLLATTLRNRSASPTYLCAVAASLHLAAVVGLTALLAGRGPDGRGRAWGGAGMIALAGLATLAALVAPALWATGRVPAGPGGNIPLEWESWGDATVSRLLARPPDPGLALHVPNILLPTLHYYLPGQRLIPYTQEQAAGLMARRVQGGEPWQVIFLSRWGADPRPALEASGRRARMELLADAPHFGQVRLLRLEQGGGCDC